MVTAEAALVCLAAPIIALAAVGFSPLAIEMISRREGENES